MRNEKLSELVSVWISRGARMEAKIQAALEAKDMSEYLEEIINQKKNARLLRKN